MENIDPKALITIGGMGMTTAIVVEVLKQALRINGRWSQLLALIIALALSCGAAMQGYYGESPDWLLVVLTGIVSTGTSGGAYQAGKTLLTRVEVE